MRSIKPIKKLVMTSDQLKVLNSNKVIHSND